MADSVKFWAVIPAAGIGKRMQADKPKQYLFLANQTVLEHTLTRLLQANIFTAISVAIHKEDNYWSQLTCSKHQKIITTYGGKERVDSVLSALESLSKQASNHDWVLVHDAVRPCLTCFDIMRLVNTLKQDDVGGILALYSPDTLKKVAGDYITQTIDRSVIWRALTPQMFRYGILKQALEYAREDVTITDEASALEKQGFRVKIVAGRPDNIKITCPEDLALAQFYIQQQNV